MQGGVKLTQVSVLSASHSLCELGRVTLSGRLVPTVQRGVNDAASEGAGEMGSLKHMGYCRGPNQTEGSARWASPKGAKKSCQPLQGRGGAISMLCSWSFLAEAAGERAGSIWLCHLGPGKC